MMNAPSPAKEPSEFALYESVYARFGFHSIWAIPGIKDFEEKVPKRALGTADIVMHRSDIGENITYWLPRDEPVTWLDLWRAADALYRAAGGGDRQFIEAFTPITVGKTDDGQKLVVLEVFFGS